MVMKPFPYSIRLEYGICPVNKLFSYALFRFAHKQFFMAHSTQIVQLICFHLLSYHCQWAQITRNSYFFPTCLPYTDDCFTGFQPYQPYLNLEVPAQNGTESALRQAKTFLQITEDKALEQKKKFLDICEVCVSCFSSPAGLLVELVRHLPILAPVCKLFLTTASSPRPSDGFLAHRS